MNVAHLFILRIVADDTDHMVQHSCQGLFYKNVMKDATRTVQWFDIPTVGVPVLRMQYTPGQGFDQKRRLQIDTPNHFDTQWASKLSDDFEKKHGVAAALHQAQSGNQQVPDMPDWSRPGASTRGAIIGCHSHNATHTFTDRYTPEQLATRLAECFDFTFRAISFNVCNVASQHGQQPAHLKIDDKKSWTKTQIVKTPEEIAALEKEATRASWMKQKKKSAPDEPPENYKATGGFIKKNFPNLYMPKTAFEHDGQAIEITKFTMVSRFLRQYVIARNCIHDVIVAGYDGEITAAHPDKPKFGNAANDNDIGRRVLPNKQFVHNANIKHYFIAQNGKNGIIQKVASPDWSNHLQLAT